MKQQLKVWGQQFRRLVSGDGLRAQLLRGGAGSLVIKAGNAVLGFALAVVLARTLGPDGYGVYSFCLAVLMLAAIPGQVGVPQLVVRETAKAQVRQDWGLMRGLWRWSNLAVAASSFIGLLAAGSVVLLIDDPQSGRIEVVTIGLALIPLIALANVRAASLRGLRMVVWGQLPESIFRPAIMLLLLGLAIIIPGLDYSSTPYGVMTLYVIAAFITFLLGGLMLWKSRPAGLKICDVSRYESLAWRRAVIPLAMVSGLQVINSHADLVILGIFANDKDVGIYRAVSQVAILVVFGLQAMNQVMQPHFARIYAEGDMERLQRLVTFSAKLILLMALPMVVAFITFGSQMLGWVFGDPFRSGGLVLAILAIGQLVNAGMGSVTMLLNMTGHEQDAMRGIAVAAISNIALNILLIPPFGIVGAAIANSAALIVWNILLRHFVKVRLDIETSAFNFRR